MIIYTVDPKKSTVFFHIKRLNNMLVKLVNMLALKLANPLFFEFNNNNNK